MPPLPWNLFLNSFLIQLLPPFQDHHFTSKALVCIYQFSPYIKGWICIKILKCVIGKHEFECYLCQLLAVWFGASHLTWAAMSFFVKIWEMHKTFQDPSQYNPYYQIKAFHISRESWESNKRHLVRWPLGSLQVSWTSPCFTDTCVHFPTSAVLQAPRRWCLWFTHFYSLSPSIVPYILYMLKKYLSKSCKRTIYWQDGILHRELGN